MQFLTKSAFVFTASRTTHRKRLKLFFNFVNKRLAKDPTAGVNFLLVLISVISHDAYVSRIKFLQVVCCHLSTCCLTADYKS